MKKSKGKAADPRLKLQIAELIKAKGGGANEAEVADIIENALKLLTDVTDSGDVRVIQTTIRELRYAFRLFAPYNEKRKVTILVPPARSRASRNINRRWSSARRWLSRDSW